MKHLTNRPLVIGIAGGSGCGKTSLASELVKEIGEENVLVLHMDQYFCNVDEPTTEASNINVDHPKHIDFQLIMKHIRQLQEGKSVFIPGFDFTQMARIWASEPTQTKPIIILEGMFALADPVARICDITCFLDVDSDERLLGRIAKDTAELGMTTQQVIDRYQRFVRPSYEVFVRPTKLNADIVVEYTFRRTLFSKFISNTLSDFLKTNLSTECFVESYKGQSASPRADEEVAYMPMASDIIWLSRAHTESVSSINFDRSNLNSPALSAFRDEPATEKSALAG